VLQVSFIITILSCLTCDSFFRTISSIIFKSYQILSLQMRVVRKPCRDAAALVVLDQAHQRVTLNVAGIAGEGSWEKSEVIREPVNYAMLS
jgi:hypothetical protein